MEQMARSLRSVILNQLLKCILSVQNAVAFQFRFIQSCELYKGPVT